MAAGEYGLGEPFHFLARYRSGITVDRVRQHERCRHLQDDGWRRHLGSDQHWSGIDDLRASGRRCPWRYEHRTRRYERGRLQEHECWNNLERYQSRPDRPPRYLLAHRSWVAVDRLCWHRQRYLPEPGRRGKLDDGLRPG